MLWKKKKKKSSSSQQRRKMISLALTTCAPSPLALCCIGCGRLCGCGICRQVSLVSLIVTKSRTSMIVSCLSTKSTLLMSTPMVSVLISPSVLIALTTRCVFASCVVCRSPGVFATSWLRNGVRISDGCVLAILFPQTRLSVRSACRKVTTSPHARSRFVCCFLFVVSTVSCLRPGPSCFR